MLSHTQPAEGMAPVPTQRGKVASARMGQCSMSLSSGTGSSWQLGRGCDTATAGPGSPRPPSLQPQAMRQDSAGASTGAQGTEPRQWAAPLGSLGSPGPAWAQNGSQVCRAGARAGRMSGDLCGRWGHEAAPVHTWPPLGPARVCTFRAVSLLSQVTSNRSRSSSLRFCRNGV